MINPLKGEADTNNTLTKFSSFLIEKTNVTIMILFPLMEAQEIAPCS